MAEERHREGLPAEVGAPGLETLEGRIVSGILAQTVIAAAAGWISRRAGEDDKAVASLERQVQGQMREMRAALEGKNPTPLERLLVERVVVCYAALTALECSAEGLPMNANRRGSEQVDRLGRRFNEACRTLAAVQRMHLPASPVFVGGQHVHLGRDRQGDSA